MSRGTPLGRKTPRVSVLMPVCDAARYLRESVLSIFGQSEGDFEVIVVDDGSTDGSPQLLDTLAALDGRASVLHRPARGIVASLNEALFLSRGDYVARMDADDIAEPGRLRAQCAYLDEHRECVVVGSNVLCIDESGLPIYATNLPLDHRGIERGLLEGRGGVMRHPAATFRRDSMLKVGGYRTRALRAEDLDIYLRLAEVGRMANLPECLLRHRLHPRSVNTMYCSELRRSVTWILLDTYRRRGLHGPVRARGRRRRRRDAVFHCSLALRALVGGHQHTARVLALRGLREGFPSPYVFAANALVLCGRRIGQGVCRALVWTRRLVGRER